MESICLLSRNDILPCSGHAEGGEGKEMRVLRRKKWTAAQYVSGLNEFDWERTHILSGNWKP